MTKTRRWFRTWALVMALLIIFVSLVFAQHRSTAIVPVWTADYATRSFNLMEDVQRWQLVVEYELRPVGRAPVDVQVLAGDCRPVMGGPSMEETCGLPVVADWDLAGLGSGPYEVWARAKWVDTESDDEIVMRLRDAASQAGGGFFVVDQFELEYMFYFPMEFEVSDGSD